MFKHYLTRIINDANRTICWDFKGFIVRAVFFCFLRHQTDVRYATHGARIKCTVLLTESDSFLIDTGIATVWNNRFSILLLTFTVPHLPRSTNHRWHGGIDNDIAWYV